MLPSFSVFGVTIPMYGLLISVGIVLGFLVAVYKPVPLGLHRQDIFFSGLFAVIGLALGAKLLYIITILPQVIARHADTPITSAEVLDLLQHGFVFYGGLIGAAAGIWIYGKVFRIRFWPLMDSLIPSVPLIHAIGRVGCFCAGCCYGVPSITCGMVFRADSLSPQGVALFPVQLMESGLNLVLFAALFIYSRKFRTDRKITGLYVTGYALIRFATEFFRGDAGRGVLLGIGVSQWISIALLPLGLYWLLKKPKAPADNPSDIRQ